MAVSSPSLIKERTGNPFLQSILQRLQSGKAVPLTALVVLWCSIFFPMLFQHRSLYWGDIGIYFHPVTKFISDQLHSTGRIPFWNPNMACGEPLAGNPQTWLFYPTLFLLNWISPERYLTLTAVGHVLIAGIGAFYYFRYFGWRRSICLIGAAAFMMNGSLVARGQFPNSVQASAYLPMILLAVERLIAKPNYGSVVMPSILIGLMLLAGHPQMAYMTLLLTFAYGFIRLWGTKKPINTAKLLTISCGLGIVIAMPQILPSVQTMLVSNRETLSYTSANRFLLAPEQALNPILPTLFGNPAKGDYIGRGNFWETCCYVGLLPIIFAFVALFRIPRYHENYKLKRFYSWVCILSLIMALGRYGGLYFFAFKLLPGLKSFHDPARWLFIMTFGVCTLCVMGMNRWFELLEFNDKPLIKARGQLLKLLCFSTLLLFIWSLVSRLHPRTALLAAQGLSRFKFRPDYPFLTEWERAYIFRSVSIHSILIFSIIITAILLWMQFTIKYKMRARVAIIAAFIILAVDAAPFSASLLPSLPDRDWQKARSTILASTITPTNGRTYTFEPWAAWWRHISYVSFEEDPNHLARLMQSLTPNLSFELGLKQADAYEPLYPLRSYMLSSAISSAYAVGDKRTDYLLDLMGVSTVLHTSLSWEGWAEARPSPPSRVYVPTTTIGCKDLAQATSIVDTNILTSQDDVIEGFSGRNDAVGTALITSETTDKVYISCNMQNAGWVVLRDTPSPGWSCSVDGKTADWNCANVNSRAVFVPVGSHTITYKYIPTSLIIGQYLAYVGWLIISFIASFYFWRDKKSFLNPRKG